MTGSAAGRLITAWRSRNVIEIVKLGLCGRHQFAGRRMLRFRVSPCLDGIAAVEPSRDTLELVLGGLELAHGNRQQFVGVERHPFVQPQFSLEHLPAEPERSSGPRGEIVFEVLDVAADRLRGFGRGIGKVSE